MTSDTPAGRAAGEPEPVRGEAGPAGHSGPAGPAGPSGPPRIACVGAVVTDNSGRLLMILRGHQPGAGLWSIPGGRIEPGEAPEQAVVREVREETGLDVVCGPLLGAIQLPGPAGTVFDVADYRAFLIPGTAPGAAAAGDDAADVRWVPEAEAAAMEERGELTAGLLATLRSWMA